MDQTNGRWHLHINVLSSPIVSGHPFAGVDGVAKSVLAQPQPASHLRPKKTSLEPEHQGSSSPLNLLLYFFLFSRWFLQCDEACFHETLTSYFSQKGRCFKVSKSNFVTDYET
ncbi:hypothetical protein AKJ16_DCAP10295 [Drosera capensis]